MSWRCTCCMEIYGDNEVCPSWEAEQREHREQEAREQEAELEALRAALNTALAHIEGRRGIFSTRDPRTVARIARQALGENVNEDRGATLDEGWIETTRRGASGDGSGLLRDGGDEITFFKTK